MRTRPNDTSVEAPTRATGKQPKGSKMDAKTLAEYQSEMTRVEDWDTVLDLCLNNQTGDVLAIPVNEPTFEAEDAGLCFNAQADKSKIPIPWEAAAVPEFPTALHDLTDAVRYPRRTFEYCRMGVEAVRRYFDPPTIKGDAERQREGEVG
jgi:hypothetical protein